MACACLHRHMEWVWCGRAAGLRVGVKGGGAGKVGPLRITEGICVGAGKDYLRRAECELYEPARGSLAGMTLEYVGDRKEWARLLIMERLVREGCWAGFCLCPLPSSPERRELEKA